MAHENTPVSLAYYDIIGEFSYPQVSLTDDHVITIEGDPNEIFYRDEAAGSEGPVSIVAGRSAFHVRVTNLTGAIVRGFTAMVEEVISYVSFPDGKISISFRYTVPDNRTVTPDTTVVEPHLEQLIYLDGILGLCFTGDPDFVKDHVQSKYMRFVHGGTVYHTYQVLNFQVPIGIDEGRFDRATMGVVAIAGQREIPEETKVKRMISVLTERLNRTYVVNYGG